MSPSQKQRRGIVAGVSALAGVAAFAVGVAGVSQYDDVATQQRDVTLVNAADDAHLALLDAQVLQNSSMYDQYIGLQESYYYYAVQNDFDQFLYVDPDASPLSTNIFNGAITRFSEAMVVSQAYQQVQWDHLLGVNQTADIGGLPPGPDGGTPGGYEALIGNGLYADLSGSGVTPDSDLDEALQALIDPTTQQSFSGFSSALVDLQNELWSLGFSDMAGMFSVGSDAGTTAAVSAFDLFDPSTWL